jgi:hypothetical protein
MADAMQNKVAAYSGHNGGGTPRLALKVKLLGRASGAWIVVYVTSAAASALFLARVHKNPTP